MAERSCGYKRNNVQEDDNDWAKFAKKIKAKRIRTQSNNNKEAIKKNGEGKFGSTILNAGEMVVQQLESEPSGVAMKYKKTGPKEFVEFNYDEFSIENLMKACLLHFESRIPANMTCDILAGQNGPSCIYKT